MIFQAMHKHRQHTHSSMPCLHGWLLCRSGWVSGPLPKLRAPSAHEAVACFELQHQSNIARQQKPSSHLQEGRAYVLALFAIKQQAHAPAPHWRYAVSHPCVVKGGCLAVLRTSWARKAPSPYVLWVLSVRSLTIKKDMAAVQVPMSDASKHPSAGGDVRRTCLIMSIKPLAQGCGAHLYVCSVQEWWSGEDGDWDKLGGAQLPAHLPDRMH